jgi:hypothetical protein
MFLKESMQVSKNFIWSMYFYKDTCKMIKHNMQIKHYFYLNQSLFFNQTLFGDDFRTLYPYLVLVCLTHDTLRMYRVTNAYITIKDIWCSSKYAVLKTNKLLKSQFLYEKLKPSLLETHFYYSECQICFY